MNNNTIGCLHTGLKIGIGLNGMMYLIFAFDEFLPLNAPESWSMENVVLKLLFIIFIVGFSISWYFELAAGIIFFIWFIIMCIYGTFICSSGNCDDGIIMGIPLFILSAVSIFIGIKKIQSKKLSQ